MSKYTPVKRDLLICVILCLAIVFIYWQVQDFKFVYYDDNEYVTEKPQVMAGLTYEGIKWAIFATEAGFWHPVTWLSLMIDRELFGNYPGGYHWTNVVIHIFNTILLFGFLRNATAAPLRSAFVALLFAIHPLHVESVAWVSQRKDLLCTLFGFASLWAYVKYAEFPSWYRYFPVIFFFVLGLMAKPMIVTFPFVMLLMDVWPLKRIKWFPETGNAEEAPARAKFVKTKILVLFAEKLPLIALSVIASVLVIYTEKKIGALTNLGDLAITTRAANAIVSYAKYIGMIFWPTGLAFFYPYPVSIPAIQIIGAATFILIVTLIALYAFRKIPYLLGGWFWYLGTLLPVIGLIQVGPHALADRYTYVTLVGLFIVMVWGVTDLAAKFRHKVILLWLVGLPLIAGLMLCSWHQIGYWRNSTTLFTHALTVTKNNHIAMNNYGFVLVGQGDVEKGIFLIKEAIKIKPKMGLLYHNMGAALYNAGRYDEAVEYLIKAKQLDFAKDETYRLLGESYLVLGKGEESVKAFQEALRLADDKQKIRDGLARALRNVDCNKKAAGE